MKDDENPNPDGLRTVTYAGTGKQALYLLAYLAEQGKIHRLRVRKIPKVDSEHGFPLYDGDELHDHEGNTIEGRGTRPPRALEEERAQRRKDHEKAIERRLSMSEHKEIERKEKQREKDRRRRDKKRRERYREIKADKGKRAADRWLATQEKRSAAARARFAKKGKK